MYIKDSFVFLDSSFDVSQGIQLRVINEYARAHGLKITFYGSELVGYEARHEILFEYAAKRRCQHFIFFSLNQFIEETGLQIQYLEKLLELGLSIHFAAQSIHEPSIQDLRDLKLLSFNLLPNARNYFTG